MTQYVKYEEWYSIFVASQLYLSYKFVPVSYAYLYEHPLALWFSAKNSTGSNFIKTGDVLLIKTHLLGPLSTSHLWGLGEGWSVAWSGDLHDEATQWRLWKPDGKIVGQNISLDEYIDIASEEYKGLNLIQNPKNPRYLTLKPYRSLSRIRLSSGATVRDENDVKPDNPPDRRAEDVSSKDSQNHDNDLNEANES